MSWTKGARVVWGAILAGSLITFLHARWPSISAGIVTPLDIAAGLFLAALLATPLFTEVTLWGLSLKQDLRKAHAELKGDIAELRASIANAIEIRTTINPNFYVGSTPPDSALPRIQSQIEDAVRIALAAQSDRGSIDALEAALSDNTLPLFRVRYAIDKQIRRIAEGRQMLNKVAGFEGRRSTMALIAMLDKAGIIPNAIAVGLRDVYAICSKAIHAEEVTPAQVRFVHSVSRELLGALWVID